jgi:hypothetical protein
MLQQQLAIAVVRIVECSKQISSNFIVFSNSKSVQCEGMYVIGGTSEPEAA